jgi:hypothetical protein
MQLTTGSSPIHSTGSRVTESEVEVQRHSSSAVTETDTEWNSLYLLIWQSWSLRL